MLYFSYKIRKEITKMKKYCIDNERMLDALIMYCEGKSCLWNALFGRKRTYFRNGEWAYSIYMIPERVYRMAVNIAKKYDDYEIL